MAKCYLNYLNFHFQASMVHELISAYELDKHMDCIKPSLATEDDLALFHSKYYLDYLKTECADLSLLDLSTSDSEMDDDSDTDDVDDEQLNYGLGYDCPKIRNLWKFVSFIAGGSLKAADLLLDGRKIVINWCGGWHHAQRYFS